VHTFGIGSEVSRALIKDCAEAGNGLFFFVDKAEEIEKKVIEALSLNFVPYLNIKGIDLLDESL
jgi:hypothetical protein